MTEQSLQETPVSIAQAESPDEIAAARALLREYWEWTNTLAVEARIAPTFKGIDDELANLPGTYAPPAGRLLLARVDGEAAGCVALKPHDAATCELKRLYVRPAFRGLQVGWQLVLRLMAEARTIGYGRMVLDSHISMTKAHAMYRAVGFHTVPTPQDFPEQLKPIVVFMECDLA